MADGDATFPDELVRLYIIAVGDPSLRGGGAAAQLVALQGQTWWAFGVLGAWASQIWANYDKIALYPYLANYDKLWDLCI